jgi:hypothetical protein
MSTWVSDRAGGERGPQGLSQLDRPLKWPVNPPYVGGGGGLFPCVDRRSAFQYYGDKQFIQEHWSALKKHMDGQRTQMKMKSGIPSFSSCGDWWAIESRAIATPSTGPRQPQLQTTSSPSRRWWPWLMRSAKVRTKPSALRGPPPRLSQ